jgi:hypothetical protein
MFTPNQYREQSRAEFPDGPNLKASLTTARGTDLTNCQLPTSQEISIDAIKIYFNCPSNIITR